MQDLVGNPVQEGDFILYATKTEAPSLQFGWVLELKEKHEVNTRHDGTTWEQHEYRLKVQHATPSGQRLNKKIFKYDDLTQRGEWVDIDKPSTAWLNGHGESSQRLLVTQPI